MLSLRYSLRGVTRSIHCTAVFRTEEGDTSKEPLITVKPKQQNAQANEKNNEIDDQAEVAADRAAQQLHPADLHEQNIASSSLLARLRSLDSQSSDDWTVEEEVDRIGKLLAELPIDQRIDTVTHPLQAITSEMGPGRRDGGHRAGSRRDQQGKSGKQAPPQEKLGYSLFAPDPDRKPEPRNVDWSALRPAAKTDMDRLHKERLSLLSKSGGPQNGWQKQIELTESGRMWTYPLDNQIVQDANEAQVHFSSHVFLEKHIREWGLMDKGPIGQFMTLVCLGLSKNAFMTIEEKMEHLEWFRHFFDKDRVAQIQKLHDEEKERSMMI